MTTTSNEAGRVPAAWSVAADAALVVGFVAIGRSTHDEAGLAGMASTAAPFLAGLGVGWVLVRRRWAPTSTPAGVVVLAATLIVGLASRRLVFGKGTGPSFILVTTATLSVFLLGWRSLVRRVARPTRRHPGR
ncbi:MAG TPA: DUF3054 domain-containing protein [Acidimicrobiia bacterium]